MLASVVPICELINTPNVRNGLITAGRAHAQWNWCQCVVTPSARAHFRLTAETLRLRGGRVCEARLVVKLMRAHGVASSFLEYCSNSDERHVLLAYNQSYPVQLTFEHRNSVESEISIKVTGTN